MPLTKTAIRAAKTHAKPVKLFDGAGLYLEVSPAGGKWWRWKYRYGGKEKGTYIRGAGGNQLAGHRRRAWSGGGVRDGTATSRAPSARSPAASAPR